MRWIGALLLISTAYLFGSIWSGEEKKRLTTVDSMLSLLKYMKRRMLSERKPLFAIFCEYEDGFLEKTEFLSIMRSNRNSKLAWSNALQTLTLDEDIRQELLLFGNELGELTLDSQIKRIDAAVAVLEDKRKMLSETLPQKQKSVKTVCLLSGALLAIIML